MLNGKLVSVHSFLQMKKGNTIEQFLYKCLENLRKEFSELRAVSVEGLMYIKEDLIIPQVSVNVPLRPTHTLLFSLSRYSSYTL